jgi:hypothetical protein
VSDIESRGAAMNNLIIYGIINLESAELVNLYSEFKQRQEKSATEKRPGQPVLFGALADCLGAEIGRRWISEEERRAILKAAG